MATSGAMQINVKWPPLRQTKAPNWKWETRKCSNKRSGKCYNSAASHWRGATRRWKPSLAAIWCCQCGRFAPIDGVGNWRGIVILWLKIGLKAGSPEEKPRQAPGDSGIKPATFPVRGRRCSQQQPLPHLLNRDIGSWSKKQILFAALFNRLPPSSSNNAFAAGPDGLLTAATADFYSSRYFCLCHFVSTWP